MIKLAIFASGNGTNLQAIIDNCNNKILNATISIVITNRKNAYANKRAQTNNIKNIYHPYIKNKTTRKEYDISLANLLNEYEYDLIVLAGWMHILSNDFLSKIKSDIINLHPALPGQFPGKNAIEQAWDAFKLNKINKTGIMVHYVVEEIDAGDVILTLDVDIYNDDTLETLTSRIQYYEKYILIKSISSLTVRLINEKLLIEKLKTLKSNYIGKVRDIYDIGNNELAFYHSDRLSAFDRNICTIPGKGKLLTNISKWWFEKTKWIIPNHMLWTYNNIMIVKKCTQFKIEVVVRAYITGTTSTSLWTHYDNGERIYCGIEFPDGLKKNQKLPKIVVTPTTKGIKDDLITESDIIKNNLATINEWKYIKDKSLQLFKFGQLVAENKGLILVDTKYEFGKDINGNIILTDELHTCDSSRFWLKETYDYKFKNGLEPDRFDKDIIRRYISNKCDPYDLKNGKIPIIADELIKKTYNAYSNFYNLLIN